MTDHDDCELEIARLSAELDRLRRQLASNRRARSRAVSIARIWKRRAIEAQRRHRPAPATDEQFRAMYGA